MAVEGHSSAGKSDRQQLPLVVNDQMQFEAIEPVDGRFAAGRQLGKHPVAGNPTRGAHRQRGRVDEGNPPGLTKMGLQQAGQRFQERGWRMHFGETNDGINI